MPWGALGSAAIGAVGSLIGGHNASKSAEAQAALQYAHQKEFAQNGIRWKVADAKAAGIHPLAALGAQTVSYNPVGVQTDDKGISEALGRMGQGVSRAYEAKQMQIDRELDRKLKEAQINQVNAQTDAVKAQALASQQAIARTALPPPMPPVNAKKPGEAIPLPSDLNVSPTIQMEGFYMDEKGRKKGLIPSEELKGRTEDVFGVEWGPFVYSLVRDLYARLSGDSVAGHYWHGGFLDGEYKPWPRYEHHGKLSKEVRKAPIGVPYGNMIDTPYGRRLNYITVEFPSMKK